MFQILKRTHLHTHSQAHVHTRTHAHIRADPEVVLKKARIFLIALFGAAHLGISRVVTP